MDFLRLFFISIALTVCSITVKAEYFNLDTVAVVEETVSKQEIKIYEPGVLKKGYRGFVEVAGGFCIDGYKSFEWEVSTSHGYQFSRHFFAGVGLNVNNYCVTWFANDINPIVFLQLRTELQKKANTPYIDLRLGLHPVLWLYAGLEVGYRHSIKDNKAWNLGVYLANGACGLRAGFEF